MLRGVAPAAPTVADVARVAGVSPTTVSHVLTGNRPVAADTERRVREVIAMLRFKPNVLARSLRTKQSQTIALLVPDITNPYYPVLARGLQDGLSAAGYHVFICNTDGVADREADLLTDVVQRHVDGIVVEGFPLVGEAVRALVPRDLPVVLLQTSSDECGETDRVVLDERAGAFQAGRFLVELGHRAVVSLAGPTGNRQQGFLDAFESAGIVLDPELMVVGDWTRSGGYAAIARLLTSGATPTAIFAANDLMAVGALDALGSRDLNVPLDVSLVGFDDIEAASLMTPALTTVRNPAYAAGAASADLLLERIANPSLPLARERVFPCSLVRRGTAAAPGKDQGRFLDSMHEHTR